MATRARQPKKQVQEEGPTLLRAVRFDNGDTYGPGEEDEFLERLEQEVEARNEARETAKNETGVVPRGLPEISVDSELERMTAAGFIVGFTDADLDEEQHSDPDIRARGEYVKNRAIIEEHPRNGGREKVARAGRSFARRGPLQDEEHPEGPGGDELVDEDDADERPTSRSRSARKRAAEKTQEEEGSSEE